MHLELVTEMTTNCFTNALERFVSRRDCCKHIYSDNGTNFVGANNEQLKISKLTNANKFSNFVQTHSIQRHFIPAKSPHFCGLWQALLGGSLKEHLKGIISQTLFTFEEFYTVLTKVEAVLNSRSLAPLSDDPSDLEATTPGHFLIEQPLTSIPERKLDDETKSYLSRYQHLQKLNQQIWKWRKHAKSQNLLGAVVLLKEENTPPLLWPLGRIEETHPGRDGLVRVVTVLTQKGVVKRALVEVSLLPISDTI